MMRAQRKARTGYAAGGAVNDSDGAPALARMRRPISPTALYDQQLLRSRLTAPVPPPASTRAQPSPRVGYQEGGEVDPLYDVDPAQYAPPPVKPSYDVDPAQYAPPATGPGALEGLAPPDQISDSPRIADEEVERLKRLQEEDRAHVLAVRDHALRQHGLIPSDQTTGYSPKAPAPRLADYANGTSAVPLEQLEAHREATKAANPDASDGDVAVKMVTDPNLSMDQKAAVLQGQRRIYDNMIIHAQGAAGHGDWDTAMQLAQKAHDHVPDGQDLTFTPDEMGLMVKTANNAYRMNPQQFMEYLKGPATSFDHALENGADKNLDNASRAGLPTEAAPDAEYGAPITKGPPDAEYGAPITGYARANAPTTTGAPATAASPRTRDDPRGLESFIGQPASQTTGAAAPQAGGAEWTNQYGQPVRDPDRVPTGYFARHPGAGTAGMSVTDKYGRDVRDPDNWPAGIPRGGQFANVPGAGRDFSEPVRFGRSGHVAGVGRPGSQPVYDVPGVGTYDVGRNGLPLAQQGQPGWQGPLRGQRNWTGLQDDGTAPSGPGYSAQPTPQADPMAHLRNVPGMVFAPGITPGGDVNSPEARAARDFPMASQSRQKQQAAQTYARQDREDTLKREEFGSKEKIATIGAEGKTTAADTAARSRSDLADKNNQARMDLLRARNADAATRIDKVIAGRDRVAQMRIAGDIDRNIRTVMGGQMNAQLRGVFSTLNAKLMNGQEWTAEEKAQYEEALHAVRENYNVDLTQPMSAPAPAVPAAAPAAPARPAQTKTINGVTYQFDGTGWRPVQ